MTEEITLHLFDYIVFISLLCVSLGVGFYFAWKEKKQSADSYLLNNDAMNPYAAGLSIFVSIVSALTVWLI
jgi:Na+/proline symporter